MDASKIAKKDNYLFEPVETYDNLGSTKDEAEAEAHGDESPDLDYDDSTVSILQTLANKSTSNLNYEESDLASVSSSLGKSPLRQQTPRSASIQQAIQTRQKSPLETPSNRMSVQDFFFNNPNSSRLSLSSPSVEETKLRSSTDYFGSGATDNDKITIPASQTSAEKPRYVKPRSKLFGEFPTRPSLEHSLSNCSIRSIGKVLLARRSRKSASSRDLRSVLDNKASFEGDGDTSELVSEDESIMSHTKPKPIHGEQSTDKVIPFGGFAKDYKMILEDSNNVFASAPWKIVPYDRGNGSLRNAVRLAVNSGHLKDIEWVGTPGMPCDLLPESTRQAISNKLRKEYAADTIYIDDDIFENHYDRYCKQVLWPILHYQLPEPEGTNSFIGDAWDDYVHVNRQFADRIIKRYKKGDTIWIHDYHLMLLPEMLRKELPDAKIGFFLHVSFPSSEVFRSLAHREEILKGVLGADSIGMQTNEYVAHFFQSCNRLLLADFDDHGVRYNNRTISVSHNPIGIDSYALRRVLHSDVVQNWRSLVRERWPDKILIVSRDKLDRIRGVKEKLLAYERFLIENPDYIEVTLLLLICIPGRAAADEKMENEILTIVERINSMNPNIASDRPVIVLNQDLRFEQYLSLLSEAGLFIVSTLREGMNLTCHEFVEASYEDHSPLILSEFVGSAAVLSGGALVTNPYNIKQVSGAIKKCMEMSAEERERRWKAMNAAVLRHDSYHWVEQSLNNIEEAHKLNTSQQPGDIKRLMQSDIDNALAISRNVGSSDYNRLFVINMEGLTSNLDIHGTTINPVQQRLIDTILNNLSSDPTNMVYLLDYSTRTDISMRCRTLPDIGMIAEDGGYVKLSDGMKFESMIPSQKLGWVPAVLKAMTSWSERIPGTYVERESSIVRLHTEQSHDIDQEHKAKLLGELMSHINELYGHDYNLHAKLLNQVVSVQEADITTKALQYIVKHTDNNRISMVFTAGGTSPIDEEVYGFFKTNRKKFANNVLTVKIGRSRESTGAEFKLQGMNELLIALSRVA